MADFTLQSSSIKSPFFTAINGIELLDSVSIPKKDKISNWDITISLKNAINELKDKERKIITERFLIGKTQMEIAEEIGISQAQVSRLEKSAIERIKKRIDIPLTEDEINYYIINHHPSKMQIQLVYAYYTKYFGSYRDLILLTRKDYMTLLLLLKKKLMELLGMHLPMSWLFIS